MEDTAFLEQIELEDIVNNVDYTAMLTDYIPSIFAIKFINFIKLVNGGKGEENKTPIMHYYMLDQVIKSRNNLLVAFRGSAKTSIMHEYMILYLATYNELDNFGIVDVAMYVSDTMDNGVKNMRKNLEFRYNNSDFLKEFVPEARFTDSEWEFTNKEGGQFFCKGFGASTGVRGFKHYGKRPKLGLLDDLMSDKNAESPTIVADIENIIYKGMRQALHPKRRIVIWTGTPFNKKDPLYKASGSKAWNTVAFPVCEKFPCTREEFVGAWEDRFDFDTIQSEYDFALANNKIDAFNQELMLRIVSDEDRLVKSHYIVWYDRDIVLRNKHRYNFYITTDFATSENQKADYSVILVWAYNSNGDWLLVDGYCKRMTMDKNVLELFKYVQMYKPQEVGVEITGQQKGFISWLRDEMNRRNTYFMFASDKNSGEEGIRPSVSKLLRFNGILPLFASHKIWIAECMRYDTLIKELLDEVLSITPAGYKSKHDDVGDAVAMLQYLNTWKPANDSPDMQGTKNYFEDEEENTEDSTISSYIV